MRIGYLDCVGGISGDMFAGALLDAGWPEEAMRAAVAWLAPEIAELHVERRRHHALTGLGIVVLPRDREPEVGHGVGHGGDCPGPHARGLREVTACLEAAPLAAEVRERALAVFRRLAEAEALAHGRPVEEIHFHEVGAVDAMVDIVSACQGLRDLKIERLHVSPLPMGQGTIEAAHGRIPLPAPATTYLLRGAPVRWTLGEGERTTPTGAALVAELGTWAPPPAMELEAVGVGAGSRPLPDVPNLARLFVGRPTSHDRAASPDPWATGMPAWGWGREEDGCPGHWGEIVCLETLLDDGTGEQIAHCAELLRAASALEVFLTPTHMKKGRPGVLLTVIARPADECPLVSILLRESPTLGVRRRTEWRRELARRSEWVDTDFGAVEVKWAWRGEWQAKPEYESCRSAATRAGVSWVRVWSEAQAVAARQGPARDTPRT